MVAGLPEPQRPAVTAVVVIPVGFVSDHMEVRHDLDLEAAETADSLGVAFARAATPGTSPRFASMITELVQERMARSEGTAPDITVPDNPALGRMGVPSQACPADCCGGTR